MRCKAQIEGHSFDFFAIPAVAQTLKIHTKRYRMPTMRHDVGLKQLAKTCSVCRREAERDETAAIESRLSAPSA